MRRTILILLIIMLCVTGFADLNLELGVCSFLDFAIPLQELSDFSAVSHFGAEDLVVGLDLELMLGILQFGAVATCNLPSEWEVEGVPVEYPGFINLGLDAGVLFQVLILRIGIGAGPTLRIPIVHERPDKPVDLGINIKGNLDIDLGGVILRLNLATFLDFIEMADEDTDGLSALPINVGISVLFDII